MSEGSIISTTQRPFWIGYNTPGKNNSIFEKEEKVEERAMPIQKGPVINRVQENFHFYIKDLRFHYGGVSFRHFVPSLQKRVAFTIINYNIREEFDAIKNYFVNVFNSKKIEVHAFIEAVNGTNRLIEVHSPQIASIDERMLQAVKFEFVKDIATKKIRIEGERTVFSMEEFLEVLSGEKLKASAFYDSEQELADDLFKIGDAKHYHHLRFLSARHAHKIMRLRFIVKPFSFLFLIEGEKHYHLIWETLDSEEATYVWAVEKHKTKLIEAVEKVGQTINTIKVLGKKAYIASSEDHYRRILHYYKLGFRGFIKWKDELENWLT